MSVELSKKADVIYNIPIGKHSTSIPEINYIFSYLLN